MKRILEYPQVYSLYQDLIGVDIYYKKFVRNFIEGQNYKNILDLGCGTSRILKFLKNDIQYVGVDISSKYVDYNRKKYPVHSFVCSDICSDFALSDSFDVIFSEGVMVAFTDEQLLKLFEVICNLSMKNTKILLSDLNYKTEVSLFEKFLQDNQRFRNFRRKEDYVSLIEKYFEIQQIHTFDKVYRIPRS